MLTLPQIYQDAEEKYARIAKELDSLIETAHAVLHPDSTSNILRAKNLTEESLFAPNTLPGQARSEIVPVTCGPNSNLSPVVAQYNRVTETGYIVMASDLTNPDQISAVPADQLASVYTRETDTDVFELHSEDIRLCIKDGRICSLYDKQSKRELMPKGMTGGMVIMEDLPNDYDAWEIESYHLQKQRHLKFEDVKVLENGPVRTTIGANVYLDKSVIEVNISLDSAKASRDPSSRSMVRFNANIDWHQSHEFLKFELPVDIHSENATYDIQFGTIQRPTHLNTTYDQEKFEVCAHKFGDLSEYGYGVAIINDSKYGYAVDGNVMRLSLLRSPKNPDPACDMHKHEINWAVYPHVGTFAESDVTEAAYAFNAPLQRGYRP